MEGSMYSLLMLLALLIAGISMHIYYMGWMHKKFSAISDKPVSKETVHKLLSIPQGPNFNSVATGSWILFFVAFAYLYFLTPVTFVSFNYSHVPTMASSPAGFFIFGLLIIVLTSPISVILPKIYSFYDIPKEVKTAIMITFPILGISLVCSAYICTLYPISSYSTDLSGAIAFITLLISQITLLSPIYIGFAEVAR